ncbi:hypothetical protein Leryth_020925 [Lithospermum erythrorhizon]|nr:hypothetical protein Leryth_020925 [Lithospermum erythrorhizon]
MEGSKVPFLCPIIDVQEENDEDMKPINGVNDFLREFYGEFKKFWYIAAPASFTIVSQYSIGAATMIFAGQLGTFQLAAVSVSTAQGRGVTMTDDLANLFYIFVEHGEAWPDSHGSFRMGGFVRLSLSAAVMDCLECWYFVVIILCAGYLKNAEIAIDALTICMNVVGLTVMVAMDLVAISVRVSNELGAGHPRAARFSVLVVLVTAFLFSTFFFGNYIVLCLGHGYQGFFG